jgi:hypothetical protein
MRGQFVNYKSADGYKGQDQFEIFILWPSGQASEMQFNVNVR